MGVISRRTKRFHYVVPKRRYSIQIKLYQRPGYDRGSLIGYIYHLGQRLKVSLGHHHIWPEHWDDTRQRMVVGAPNWERVNADIDGWINRVVAYFATRTELGELPTIEGLRATLMPDNARSASNPTAGTVVAWFARFLREHTKNGRPLAAGTVGTYKVVLSSWKSFEHHAQRQYELRDLLQDGRGDTLAGRKIMQEYQRYLIDGRTDGRACSDNTIRKYLKILNTFLRWCEERTGKPLIKNVSMQGEITSKHSFALTQQDVDKLVQLSLKPGSRLDIVRDAMLVAIYTGLRHSEWVKLRPELWREPSQLITSKKTGKVCLVVHREPLRQILIKYESRGFPRSTHNIQLINRNIKELAKLAGLTRNVKRVKTIDGVDHHETVPLYAAITTHTFRRTKITLELNQGRPLRDIVMETGQDEMIARKHYDRPDLEEHVRKLGVDRVQ